MTAQAPVRRSVVVVGATGLVGGHLVDILAADPSVAGVLAPGRRVTDRWRSVDKVATPVVDFASLEASEDAFAGNQVFLCLGTTMRKAGSREAFRRVDFDAVLASARAALAHGADQAFLVSSVGADPGARSFYLRVKGEVENALAALPFRAVHVFRPSVLTGDRGESRPGERLGIALGTLLSPLMVGATRRYRPIAARTVARAMARSAASPPAAGRHVHESEEIAALGQ